ncbi:MAG: DUF3109 family protein [Bacteroidales bacterium]|jgi:hypothetical protein|nr:DUF3109 family protein [Bacteroidales bacterium]
MIHIGNAIVSLDVLEKRFACSLPACRGMCCVQGEAGAPLEDGEIPVLESIYPKVKACMTPEGVEVVEREGVFVIDRDGDRVTPLTGTEECVFACSENGMTVCAIEKACRRGETDFPKPISCHLYPVRITRYSDFEAVNYHRWDVCAGAPELGKERGTPLYVFLREALLRKYGAEWYAQLCVAAEYLEKKRRR